MDNSAYVVSYGNFPPYAFAASYDDAVEGMHEKVYYARKYKLGPDPSSTLPRVAVTVVDGNVWVDPAQAVPGLVSGAEAVRQPAKGPYCQDAQEGI